MQDHTDHHVFEVGGVARGWERGRTRSFGRPCDLESQGTADINSLAQLQVGSESCELGLQFLECVFVVADGGRSEGWDVAFCYDEFLHIIFKPTIRAVY